MFLLLAALALLAPLVQAVPAPAPAPAPPPATTDTAPPPVFVARVVRRYPHDAKAFTEGLVWHAGALYESVGEEGVSDVRRVRLADGRVMARAAIPAAQFGEGLAAFGDTLVSLTWHDSIAHRWNAKTLKRTGESRFVGEGWGLASDGAQAWLSDGTSTIRRLDAATFAVRGRITVTLRGRPLDQINELEMIDGALYANVWHQPFLVRIDPASGRVTGVVDLRPLVAEVAARDPEAVANGIAWDAKGRRLFVTGKLWPTLFEVRLEPSAP